MGPMLAPWSLLAGTWIVMFFVNICQLIVLDNDSRNQHQASKLTYSSLGKMDILQTKNGYHFWLNLSDYLEFFMNITIALWIMFIMFIFRLFNLYVVKGHIPAGKCVPTTHHWTGPV